MIPEPAWHTACPARAPVGSCIPLPCSPRGSRRGGLSAPAPFPPCKAVTWVEVTGAWKAVGTGLRPLPEDRSDLGRSPAHQVPLQEATFPQGPSRPGRDSPSACRETEADTRIPAPQGRVSR